MIPLALLVCLVRSGMPDAVFLEHSAEITALPDSGYVELTREVIVPLTGHGVERYRSMSITHREGWETVEVLTARTGHWRAGRGSGTAEIGEIPHRALVTDGRLEATLRETVVTFTGLERGDTLFLEVLREIESLPVADFYCYSYYSGGRDSVDQGSLTVTWPADRPLYVSESPLFTAGYNERRTGADIVRTWTCGPEPASPGYFLAPGVRETAPSLLVAGSTPEEVSLGLYLVLDLEACDGNAVSEADSVIAATGDDPEELRRWVSSEIEYIGADWGEYPGFTPRSPVETLEYRSGVCRDNALLLAWLLRRTGLEADLVLTFSGGIGGDLAGSRSFDHMLVRIPDGDGYRFLDPTRTPSETGTASSYRGLRYLALTDPGSGLELFPDPASGDTLRVVLDGRLDTETGRIDGHVELWLSGAAADLYRSMIERTGEDRRGELLDVLTGATRGSGVWEVPDPREAPDPMVIAGDCIWDMPVLHVPDGIAVLLPGLQETSLSGTRTAALLLPEELSNQGIRLATPVHEILEMTLRGFEGTPSATGADTSGTWSRSSLMSGPDTLVIREECVMEPALPDSAAVQAILRGLEARCGGGSRTVVFR